MYERPTKENIDVAPSRDVNTLPEEQIDESTHNPPEAATSTESSTSEASTSEASTSVASTSPVAILKNTQTTRLIKRKANSNPSVATVLQNYLTTRPTTAATTTEVDWVGSFFNSMAASVRTLPLDLQLKAKGQIFNIIFDIENESLDRRNS